MATTSTSLMRRTGVAIAVMLLVAFFAATASWAAQGGRWFNVATPSMGETAPVGTLLLTKPTSVADTKKGDFITFRAPKTKRVYSHRVEKVTPQGLITKGDVNPTADSWVITDRDLVGKVRYNIEGAGTFIKAVPLLAIGGILVWLLTMRLRPDRRTSYRFTGSFIVISVVNWMMKPWVGIERRGQVPDKKDEGVLMELISTGHMPIKATDVKGHGAVHLDSGQVATIHLLDPDKQGVYRVVTQLDLSLLWWIVLILVVLSPLLWTSLVGFVTHDEEPAVELADEEMAVVA